MRPASAGVKRAGALATVSWHLCRLAAAAHSHTRHAQSSQRPRPHTMHHVNVEKARSLSPSPPLSPSRLPGNHELVSSARCAPPPRHRPRLHAFPALWSSLDECGGVGMLNQRQREVVCPEQALPAWQCQPECSHVSRCSEGGVMQKEGNAFKKSPSLIAKKQFMNSRP